MPECGVCNCVSSQPSHFGSDFANSWKAGWLRGWFHTWLHRWLQSSVINEKRLVWLKFIWLYHVLARGELPYISLGAYDVFSSDLGTRKNFFKRIKFPLYCFLFICLFHFLLPPGSCLAKKRCLKWLFAKSDVMPVTVMGRNLKNVYKFSTRILIPPDPKIIYACVYGNSQ